MTDQFTGQPHSDRLSFRHVFLQWLSHPSIIFLEVLMRRQLWMIRSHRMENDEIHRV